MAALRPETLKMMVCESIIDRAKQNILHIDCLLDLLLRGEAALPEEVILAANRRKEEIRRELKDAESEFKELI